MTFLSEEDVGGTDPKGDGSWDEDEDARGTIGRGRVEEGCERVATAGGAD